MAIKKPSKQPKSKKIEKDEEEVINIEQKVPKKYSLWVKLNDIEYAIETDNIAEALMEIKPTVLKTRVLVKLREGMKTCDKILSGMQARQIFRNKLAMSVFLNRVIFK